MGDIKLTDVYGAVADAIQGQRLLDQVESLKKEHGATFRSRELLEYMRDNEVYDIHEAYDKFYEKTAEKMEVEEARGLDFNPQPEQPTHEVGAINRDNLAKKVSDFLSQGQEES